MGNKDKIAMYYSNARELVKQNQPKAARAYILAILSDAVQTYEHADSILLKAKTAAFLDQWLAVSRELYSKGVTDFVLRCFGLPAKPKKQASKKNNRSSGSDPSKRSEDPEAPVRSVSSNTEIDISGLIDESAKTQGWCAEVFEKNKASVVKISVSNHEKEATGTGFIISKKGYLLTNDHVVYDEDSEMYYPTARVTLAGNKKSYKLNILFSDKKTDVALCSFHPEDVGEFTTIQRISDYSQVLQGADCLVIGNAFDMGLAPFTGIIRFTKNSYGDLVYTAPSNPGDSGGPVLNRNGECIGIHKSVTTAVNDVSAEGFVNATPMDTVNELLKKWTDSNGIDL